MMRLVHLAVIALLFWAATFAPARQLLSHNLWGVPAGHAVLVAAGVLYGVRATRAARSYAA